MDLKTPLEKDFRISESKKKVLKKLGLLTISDLLYYFPTRYGNFSKFSNIQELKNGEPINIYAKVLSIQARKTFKTKIAITEAVLEDYSGEKIKAI